MSTLRFGILVALAGLLVIGCDDGRGDEDAGTDSGLRLMDSGPMVDSGGGGGTDSGGGGTDAGGGGGSCGPTGGACDVSNPSSCGTGMACLLSGSSADGFTTQCAASGVLGQDQTCDPTMAGQCQEGYQCNSGSNTCRKICCGNTDCPTGVICQQIAGADGAGFCRPSDACNITDASSCGSGNGCYPLGTEGDTQCLTAGTATEGMTCDALNACVAGHGCAGTPATCRQYCNPTSPSCPTDYTCAGLTDTGGTAIPGVGVCVPPST